MVNPKLYNAVAAGITGGNQLRWSSQSRAIDPTFLNQVTVTIATAIDDAIGNSYAGECNTSQAALIRMLCQGEFSRRNAVKLPVTGQGAAMDAYNAQILPGIVNIITAAYDAFRTILDGPIADIFHPAGIVPANIDGITVQEVLDSIGEKLNIGPTGMGLIIDSRTP